MYPSFAGNPNLFFATAAGPDVSDIVGPPLGVLDVYGDGTPMATSAHAQAVGKGGGGATAFYMRADVQSFAVLLLGLWMIHRYARG